MSGVPDEETDQPGSDEEGQQEPGTADKGVQATTASCDAATQSLLKHSLSATTQTECDGGSALYRSKDHDSDSSYEPFDSEPESEVSQEDIVNDLQNLERMRSLCKRFSKDYLGLNQEGLVILELVSEQVKSVCGSQNAKLTSLDACMLVMVKIKQDRPFKLIADDFGISRSYAGRLWNLVLPQIVAHVRSLIFWPDADEIRANLPLAFKARFSKVTCIIDCMEIEIEKPSGAVKQAKTWSAYKNCNTVKFLISIIPSGMVNFVSGGYGGRTSDMEIVEKSGFTEKLKPGMAVMGDRGFKGIEPLLRSKGCFLIRPDSVSSNEIPAADRVLFSKQVASLRVHVERAIRRIREFAMVKPHAVVENAMIPHLDRIVNAVCGFVNLQHDLIKV